MKRIFGLLFVMLFLMSGATFALAADFSGTWVLDPEKSDLGKNSPAIMHKVVLVIKQSGNVLTIERSVNNRKDTAVFKLDGSESINSVPSGGEIRTRMRWQGSNLVSKSTSTAGGIKQELSDVRSLSADGRVMTLKLTRQTPRGEQKNTLVYNKQ